MSTNERRRGLTKKSPCGCGGFLRRGSGRRQILPAAAGHQTVNWSTCSPILLIELLI